jgi:hypothetical protein
MGQKSLRVSDARRLDVVANIQICPRLIKSAQSARSILPNSTVARTEEAVMVKSTVTVLRASHMSLLSHPREVAAVIEDAAAAAKAA